MKITLTNIPLASVPDDNQVFHLFWKKDGEPDGAYRTLPDATVNPSGVILSPSPYQFNTEGTIDTDIYVKAVSDCNEAFTETKLFPGMERCCAGGYTLSLDGTYCYKNEDVAATPPTDSENSVAKTAIDYSICGSWIYSSFNLDGTGPSTQIPLSNLFWVNGPGNCLVGGTTVDGPMNRCALWSVSMLSDQQIGFSVCINVPETKNYYIAVGADNYAIVKVDGVTILSQNRTAMDAQYGTPGGSGPLRVWAIYPIVLSAGTRVLELIGVNGPEPIPNPAAIGAEIYNNTSAEIISATSYADLNLIFSTKDYIGQPIQIGTDGIGYSCPDDYSLVMCDVEVPFCRKVLIDTVKGC